MLCLGGGGRGAYLCAMNTLSHPHAAELARGPSFAPVPVLHAAVRRLAAAWQRLGMTGPERFIADSTDLAHLERRLRMLERDGWPPR